MTTPWNEASTVALRAAKPVPGWGLVARHGLCGVGTTPLQTPVSTGGLRFVAEEHVGEALAGLFAGLAIQQAGDVHVAHDVDHGAAAV